MLKLAINRIYYTMIAFSIMLPSCTNCDKTGENSSDSLKVVSDSDSVSLNTVSSNLITEPVPKRGDITNATIIYQTTPESHLVKVDSLFLTSSSATVIRNTYTYSEQGHDAILTHSTVRFSRAQISQLWRIIDQSVLSSVSPLSQYVDSLEQYRVACPYRWIVITLDTPDGSYVRHEDIREEEEGYVYSENLQILYKLLTGENMKTNISDN